MRITGEFALKKYALLILMAWLCLACTAQAAQLNKIAAVVNGQVITMFDLQKAALPELGRARLNPNDPKQADKVNVVFRKVLDSMIMDILLEQEAKRLSITVSDSEIDQELTKMMKMRRLNRAQFEAELKRQGMSVDELRKSMKTNMLRQRVMGAEVGRRVVVTDDEIRAYYEKHKDTMYDRNGLHMGLIVYNPNVNARSIAAQIASGALSFEEAARKYSIAPNREKGGDMGPVEWGRLNPEWETRLNKMKPGDVTDIFTVQGHKAQVHLFRPGQSGPGRPMTFEEARPVIDNILRQPKAMERFDEYSQQLRSKAVIDIRL